MILMAAANMHLEPDQSHDGVPTAVLVETLDGFDKLVWRFVAVLNDVMINQIWCSKTYTIACGNPDLS